MFLFLEPGMEAKAIERQAARAARPCGAHEMMTAVTMANAAAVASIGHVSSKALISECGMVIRIVDAHPLTASGF
jgi:hypothetical protein